LSTIKITVKNINFIDQQKIKSLGAKGIMISNNVVTIVFGDNSISVKKAIDNL